VEIVRGRGREWVWEIERGEVSGEEWLRRFGLSSKRIFFVSLYIL
jgi:hypothetical protein